MLVMIYDNLESAKEVSSKLYKDFKIESCAVEVEFNNEELNSTYEGISMCMNHHSIGGIQPSLVYKEEYPIYSSFAITHIDADTIFGIGWVSGLFPKNSQFFKKLSDCIAEIDSKGIHNIKVPKDLEKEIQIVFSIVAEAKNKLSKLKYKQKYNVTNIVKKAILKIKDHMNNPKLLNWRYKLICENLDNVVSEKKYTTEKVHVYRKKINDFNDASHNFIIVYSRGITVYGRNDKITKRYFPQGLSEFLNGFFEGSGGHFSAAGTKRNQSISRAEFDTFYDAFILHLDKIDKPNFLKIRGDLC